MELNIVKYTVQAQVQRFIIIRFTHLLLFGYFYMD